MNLHPIVKSFLFGLGAFSIFLVIAGILKLVSKVETPDAEYFGLFTNSDLMLGVAVALVITLSHERRKGLRK
jgi:hypothetical protein